VLQPLNVSPQDRDLVFGDVDGVVVVPQEAEQEVVRRALEKISGENSPERRCSEEKSWRASFGG